MTEEDKKYRQGRSKFRVEQTERVAGWSIVGCLVCLLIISLFNAFKYAYEREDSKPTLIIEHGEYYATK